MQRNVLSRGESRFMRCWDLGGQDEYETANALLVARVDILLFVVNLERTGSKENGQEEVKELCHWMQLAYMLVRFPKEVRTIIVGTHRGKDADSLAIITYVPCRASGRKRVQ